MKDSEVRGIILRRLYEVRHVNHGMIDIPDRLGILDIAPQVLGNCAAQLNEQGLIKFSEYMGKPYRFGRASITAYGVDVIEENANPSIAVTLDQSISISGSSNVQVGRGNALTNSDAVQSSNAGKTAIITQPKSDVMNLLKRGWSIVRKWLGAGT